MARTQKNKAAYFPHDANASTGDTLTVLQGKYGNDGYAFWFKLLEKLTSTEGHCVDLNNATKWKLFVAKMGVDEITTVEIMNLLVEMDAIDRELWQSKLVWSQNLVDNLSEVYRNRRRELPQKPIVPALITTCKKAISTPKNGITTAQSKVKNSKVDNKEKYIKRNYGEFKNVLLTDEEYGKLEGRFNKQTPEFIERLSAYMASRGKDYKSHYATILNWAQRDKREGTDGKTRGRDLPKEYTEPPDYGDE